MNIAQEIKRLNEHDPSLTELNLNASNITLEQVNALASALYLNKDLKILDFSNNFIGAQGATYIAKALEKNRSLHTLYLRSNDIGDNGAQALSEVLRVNDQIKNIYLGNNNIGFVGAKALASSLGDNSTLEILSLRNNAIGDEGAIELANNLEVNTSVKTLNLANTEIEDEGASHLAHVLSINTNIVEMNVNYNEIDDEDIIEEIKTGIQYNGSQNVVAVNKIARKILTYCEEHLTQEEMGDMRNISAQELARKYALGKEDLYYLSNKNSHGGAILCLASLYRMALNKYDQVVVDFIMKSTNNIYGALFSCFKEELRNDAIQKPSAKIIAIATNAAEKIKL